MGSRGFLVQSDNENFERRTVHPIDNRLESPVARVSGVHGATNPRDIVELGPFLGSGAGHDADFDIHWLVPARHEKECPRNGGVGLSSVSIVSFVESCGTSTFAAFKILARWSASRRVVGAVFILPGGSLLLVLLLRRTRLAHVKSSAGVGHVISPSRTLELQLHWRTLFIVFGVLLPPFMVPHAAILGVANI